MPPNCVSDPPNSRLSGHADPQLPSVIEVLKEVLKIISDMVSSIYLKFVLISELLTLAGLIITLNTN